MFTKNIIFKNFQNNKKNNSIKYLLISLLKQNNEVIKSLSSSYKNSYDRKIFKIFNKKLDFRVIGMGGSSLGAQTIYDFLKKKIKKQFCFVDNLKPHKEKKSSKYFNNLVISKSGNTIETIVNSNILIKKNDKNLFITETKPSYLKNLAYHLKSEVVEHNNYIGGRYSVLSEVGMLPSELMGLDPKKFRQLNNLIKNKVFMQALIKNVSSTVVYLKKKNLIQLLSIMTNLQLVYLIGINS